MTLMKWPHWAPNRARPALIRRLNQSNVSVMDRHFRLSAFTVDGVMVVSMSYASWSSLITFSSWTVRREKAKGVMPHCALLDSGAGPRDK